MGFSLPRQLRRRWARGPVRVVKPVRVSPSRGSMTVDAPTEVVELPMGDITADSRSSAPPDQASATTLPISPAAHHDLKGRAVLPSSPLAHTETAHSDEAPTEAYVGLDGPSVGSPSRGGPDDKTDVMEGAAIP